MNEIIKINSLEVASELADKKVNETMNSVYDDIYHEDMDGLSYTETAQDLFNDYYDDYLTLLTNLQIH